jgi:hypothetical protein
MECRIYGNEIKGLDGLTVYRIYADVQRDTTGSSFASTFGNSGGEAKNTMDSENRQQTGMNSGSPQHPYESLYGEIQKTVDIMFEGIDANRNYTNSDYNSALQIGGDLKGLREQWEQQDARETSEKLKRYGIKTEMEQSPLSKEQREIRALVYEDDNKKATRNGFIAILVCSALFALMYFLNFPVIAATIIEGLALAFFLLNSPLFEDIMHGDGVIGMYFIFEFLGAFFGLIAGLVLRYKLYNYAGDYSYIFRESVAVMATWGGIAALGCGFIFWLRKY